MKNIFIFIGTMYLMIFAAPFWLILIIYKTRNEKIIDELTVFYDSIFNGVFVPIEKMLGVYKPPKKLQQFNKEFKLEGVAQQAIEQGDVCEYEPSTGDITKKKWGIKQHAGIQ